MTTSSKLTLTVSLVLLSLHVHRSTLVAHSVLPKQSCSRSDSPVEVVRSYGGLAEYAHLRDCIVLDVQHHER